MLKSNGPIKFFYVTGRSRLGVLYVFYVLYALLLNGRYLPQYPIVCLFVCFLPCYRIMK